MNKVIALRGRQRIGKSQTIRTVDELLRVKYPDVRVEHEHRTRADLTAVLGINGMRIGIDSHNDPKHLDLLVRLGCELIICATRTSGRMVTAVNALPGYEVVWLEQQPHDDLVERVLSNLRTAREIVEQTEESIAAAKPVVLRRAAGR